jgi:hypothetical protein
MVLGFYFKLSLLILWVFFHQRHSEEDEGAGRDLESGILVDCVKHCIVK